MGLLSELERARFKRFLFDGDRQAFLLAHALKRTGLGLLLGVSGKTLTFSAEPGEKPRLLDSTLDFSLSHTRGFAAVAATTGGNVGVDVEAFTRASSIAALRETVLTKAECEMLDQCNPAESHERIVWLWTAKEAVMKACGLGLALHPRYIEIEWHARRARTSEYGKFRLLRFRAGEYGGAIAMNAEAAEVDVRWFADGQMSGSRSWDGDETMDLTDA